jgi:hypothetical protein
MVCSLRFLRADLLQSLLGVQMGCTGFVGLGRGARIQERSEPGTGRVERQVVLWRSVPVSKNALR